MAVWNLGHFIAALSAYNGSRLMGVVLTDDVEGSGDTILLEIESRLDKSFVRAWTREHCAYYRRNTTKLLVTIQQSWADVDPKGVDAISIYVPSWSLKF